jgi:hypothetical protein
VHEEPIVNRPEECARALTDGRIDFVVTNSAAYAAIDGPRIARPRKEPAEQSAGSAETRA